MPPLSLPPSSPPATVARDAVLGALVSGALLPADVAGLPAPVAIVAALCSPRGGVRLPVAVTALREAGFADEAEGLPAAAQGRVRRPRAIEAVAELRARCAGEVARDGNATGDGVGGLDGSPAEERAIVLMGYGAPDREEAEASEAGLEGAAELPAPEAQEDPTDDALTLWAPVPALAPASPLAPWTPEPDPALVALFSRLRAATTGPGASCDGRAGKGPRCGRCVRCKREAPVRSPAGVWLQTWRG